jgi:hypothetical protein
MKRYFGLSAAGMALLGVGLVLLLASFPHLSPGAALLGYPLLPTPPSPVPDSLISALTGTAAVPPPESTQAPSPAAQAALAYFAAAHDIPAETIVIAGDLFAEYPHLQRQFRLVTLLDTRPFGKFYHLMVDLQTGEVIEDVASMDAAEQQAKISKFGKFEPALYEQLQDMAGIESVTVMIWVRAGPGESLAEREARAVATVVAIYPEAKAAVDRGSKLMDVGDPILSRQIEEDYYEILDADVISLVQPLADTLRSMGLSPRTFAGLPAVIVSPTKNDLLRIEPRRDVGAIGLAEGDMQIVNQILLPN